MSANSSDPSQSGQLHLSQLRNLQNSDGGWGFNVACESRVEPTAWALLALEELGSSPVTDEAINRGFRFLADVQLPDGSWPAAPGQREGCWVTSLACWALSKHQEYSANVDRGMRWLSDDRPRDSGFWWRTIRKLTERKKINAQNAWYSGWSWTPHTASWVEPTCYALIGSRSKSIGVPPANLSGRRKVAEAMLYDRMCPGGGWNCGNPRVYGVAGQPQVGPTVWALIALRENSGRAENRQSLDWLETQQNKIQSPESFALAHICLSLFGRPHDVSAEGLRTIEKSESLPWSVPAMAWAALALSESRGWLTLDSATSS
jgi:hypothetical protein